MIGKLFKPAWEHKDPERRIAAIATFSEDNSDQQEILEAIAQSDVESKVRDAAIFGLSNLRVLERLCSSEKGETAQARLLQLVSSKEGSHQKSVVEFVAEAEMQTLLLVLQHCPSSDARGSALGRVKDQDQLASIASDSEFADTREMAAASVERLDLLEPLWKKVRERDKNLAKTLHERIEALQKVEQRLKQVAERGEAIIVSMAELKESTWTPQYNLRFLALVNQWQQVESEVGEDIGNRYRELAIGVEAVVIDHRRVLEVIEQQQQLLIDAEQLQSDAQELSLSELEVQMERWAMLRRLWLDSLVVAVPEEASGQRFDQVAAYFLAVERILANQSAFAGLAVEPPAESSVEPQAEVSSEPEIEVPAETPVEVPVESESDAAISEQSSTESQEPESESVIESDPESETSPEAEAEAGIETEAETETEAVVEVEDKTEPKAPAASEGKKSSPVKDVQSPELKQQIVAMKGAIKSINWPANTTEPAALVNLKSLLKTQEVILKEEAALQRQQVESTGKQIARLNAAVRRGDLKMARGVYKKIEARFEKHSSAQQSKLQEQWDKASSGFKEMLDWKEFAIQPKFIELCEQMEALSVSASTEAETKSPQQQAEVIKKLQQSWKKLEALAPDDIWQRFQAAGDKAFEPCAAFYAELDVQRAENLAQRKLVVEKLKALVELPENTDWQESPDWKSLRNKLREVREEWRKYAEVDQQKCRKLGKKYGDLTRKLETHIKAECDANLARKKQLVDRAIAMSAMDSAAISLDQLKELQGSWKHIGITERRDDQKMWKAFQEACDAVFAKHRQKIDESRAEEKAQSDAAKNLIQSIRALAKTEPGTAPDESKLNELMEQYSQLPPVHEPIQKGLDRDLQKAIEAVQSSVKQFKRDRKNQYLVEMRRRADICATLEALDTDKDASKVEKLLGDWESQPLASEAAQLMETRKESALAKKFTKADFDEADRERRLVCIELEAKLGKDTPAEDQSLRMQYQLELMKSKGLGANSNRDLKTDAEATKKRWYQMPAADKKTQAALDERFHELVNLFDGK
jgi:DNA repair protein SbcC/Rad50